MQNEDIFYRDDIGPCLSTLFDSHNRSSFCWFVVTGRALAYPTAKIDQYLDETLTKHAPPSTDVHGSRTLLLQMLTSRIF